MKNIKDDSELMASPDLLKMNRRILEEAFPEAFMNGEIKWEVLRHLLGEKDDEQQEKYGLSWMGKRAARQVSLSPSNGTLLPSVDDSVDWNTTNNVLIEGDNLEVLKLLQKSYASKVKLIYIDPPYNTGKDFVYSDDLHDNINNYLAITGQVENGKKVSSNTETSGRFHTAWLNMIYPRLRIARNLLREDGVIFVSIDDHEKHNLISVMCEIFGEENFVGVFVWKRRTGAMDSVNNVSIDHEYVVCFSRSVISLNGESRTFERYSNPDNDRRGPWIADNLSAAKPGGDTYYAIKDPTTGNEYWPPKGRYWPYSRVTMQQKISEGRVIFPSKSSGSPLLKRFKNEAKSIVQPTSTWIYPLSEKGADTNGDEKVLLRTGHTSEGTKIVKDLFGDKVFTYAKPISLLDALIGQGTLPDKEDIVLDFFAGSGTTGHAVLAKNAKDGGNRRFILVQLPEPLSDDVEEQQLAAAFCDKIGKPRKISELTKERLRRAGGKLKEEGSLLDGDVGFRVFRLASSNIRSWNPDKSKLEQSLLEHYEHILPDRTEADIVYELLLKLGLDLCVPMESRTVAGKTVGAVGGGVLMLCLAEKISATEVEAVAAGIVSWHKELAPAGDSTVVFRDSAFADDVAKTNMAAILAQNGLENVRSL